MLCIFSIPSTEQVVDTVYTFESEEAAIAFASGPAFELFSSGGEAREFTRSKVGDGDVDFLVSFINQLTFSI